MITKISPNQLMLQSTIKNKRFSLQFLPEKLESISTLKKVKFNNQNLKPSYLIDIVHNLILKYYFKRENSFNLNATILKEKYGHLYNHYIKYLIDNGIISLQRNYKKGQNSRVYSLVDGVLEGKIGRYKNSDKILLKKYINRYYQFEIDTNNLIPSDIKDKLIMDLYSVKIEYERAIFFLTSLKNEDVSIYNRNRYSVDSINDNHIFYHFDHFGRMHSNYTILKTFLRKNCLLIDGEETYERDISNSQPFFLYKLIVDCGTKWVKSNELSLFRNLVKSGNFYQYLIDSFKLKGKVEAKEMTYKVFFGKNHKNSRYDKLFEFLFPTVYYFITLYKKEHRDYKSLAYELQKMESNFIFNGVIRTIMIIDPEIKMITIHDSIICQSKYRRLLDQIFDQKLNETFQ